MSAVGAEVLRELRTEGGVRGECVHAPVAIAIAAPEQSNHGTTVVGHLDAATYLQDQPLTNQTVVSQEAEMCAPSPEWSLLSAVFAIDFTDHNQPGG